MTTYRGFSAVSGETTFTQDMADIKNGKHAKLIIKIASLVAQGKVEEANHVKKQLPFRTLTANYRERRLAPSITRYNPVITLDIDDLEEGQLEQTRTLINEDPHTLGSFLSPKRHGYKLFVFMQTEYTRRLYDRLRQGEVTYATLEEIHLKLYSAAKEHYEALLGVEVDGSGKDISRGYFMSFDPHAYINAALLEQISPKQGQSEHKYVLKLTSLRHISYIFVHIFYRTTLFNFVRAKPIDIEIITLFYGTVNNASCLIYCNCVQIRTGNTVGMTKNVTSGIVASP